MLFFNHSNNISLAIYTWLYSKSYIFIIKMDAPILYKYTNQFFVTLTKVDLLPVNSINTFKFDRYIILFIKKQADKNKADVPPSII